MFELRRSNEQAAIAEVVADISMTHLYPAAKEAEQANAVPTQIWNAVFQLGLTSPVAERFGGGGVPDVISQLLAIEGLSWGDPGIAAAIAFSGVPAVLIGAIGTAAQQQAWLPSLAINESSRSSCALYEGFGRSPSELTTQITREEAGWRIKGSKVAVPFAESADLMLVIGIDPSAGHLRAGMITPQDRSDRGVQVLGADQLSGSAAALSLHAAQMRSVSFDLVVPEDQLLGGPDLDAQLLSNALNRARLVVPALLLGTAQRASEYAADYAQDRVAFGKPISAFQGVSFMLADALMQLDAARFELWQLAIELEGSTVDGDLVEADRKVSHCVNYSAAVATSVTRDSVQVLGGHGFIEDHPVERWYRAAAALSVLDFDPTCSPFAVAL